MGRLGESTCWGRTADGWCRRPFSDQMGNAGMDVWRALKFRRAGNRGRFLMYAASGSALLAATAECQAGNPANLRIALRALTYFNRVLAAGGEDVRGEAVLDRYFLAWGLRANRERSQAESRQS